MMDKEAELAAAGSPTAITFPTGMAERMDEKALQAVAARIHDAHGTAKATLGPGFVRYDLPEGGGLLPEDRAFLVDATAREALRARRPISRSVASTASPPPRWRTPLRTSPIG